MKNKVYHLFVLIITGMCSLTSLKAQSSVELSFESGLSKDHFSWDIAGNLLGQNPNVLSELTWRNLLGVNSDFGIEIRKQKKLSLSVKGSYTSFLKGEATDVDFAEDNRRSITFLGTYDPRGSKYFAGSFLLHYKVIQNDWFTLQPQIGFGASKSLYKITDAQIPTLNTSYSPIWYGCILGLGASFRTENWEFEMTFQYQQYDYFARANWNLIDSFKHPVSFDHRAKGFGLNAMSGINRKLSSKLNVYFRLGYNYRKTGKGIERLYLVDNTIIKTRVNSISKKLIRVNIGVSVQI